jgi:flagellar hook-associated protein 1 FlgK
MGLLSALSNAVSGLNINQQNLDVLSQNISNANTPNYSNEVVNQQASFLNGLGAGVTLESITRTVDQFLTSEVQGQTSVNSAASTVQSYYSQIENLLGTPGTTNSLDQTIDSFFTAVQNQANSPSVSSQTTVVNSAVALASQVSGLANSLQGLRLQADSDINSGVSAINADLQTLTTTNTALERAAATNQPTGGLLDQRDAALADIAQYIDIKPTYQNDGEVTVNTTNGLTLLTPTNSSVLSYQPVGSLQALVNNTPLAPIQVQELDASGNPLGKPITLATGGTSSSVTTSLVSGKIQALLSVRDSVIPDILGQLDQLASSLRDGVNAITNAGTSSPPPNSYTGVRSVTASAVSQYSGNVQIALLDSSGNPVPSPYADETNGLQPLTLDLGALAGSGGTGVLSTNDIINAINQYYGTPQNKTEIGNINNVQLGVLSNNVPDTGNTLNFDFNLNNISASNAAFYVTGVTVLDSNGNALPSGDVTSTIPSVTVSSYATAQSGSSVTATLTLADASGLTAGQTVLLGAPSGSVNGLTPSQLTGPFTVQSVSGNTITVTVPNATETSSGTAAGVTGSLEPPYATVDSGQTLRTGADGSVTVSGLSSGSNNPYYTVQANIATVDSSGNIVTSTVSYRVPNNSANTMNDLIGATSVTAGATLVAPTTTQPLLTASLVDANGNPLTETNGSYGNQQGYLKITADNSSYTVAINEMDSQQLGLPDTTPPQAGTNQGFSQYFGLNDFFNPNSLTSTGDTTTNSAINLSVESRIVNNPGLVSTGTLAQGDQPTAGSSSPPNFTYILAPGDNSISQQLAALSTATQSFAASGGMPPSSTTLSQYAGQIIAKTSSDSDNATNTASDSQTLLSGFTTRAQAVSGVNLDQELANTVIYQNAYTASTRVITVVSTMFQELLGIIQ